MFNNFVFNSGEFNDSAYTTYGSADIAASIVVNTNPSLATFKEILATLSVAAQVNSDDNASITVSSYKWLTPALTTAQAGPAFRPYFTCKIVDDTITPNAIVTVPNSSPYNGDGSSTPDGYLVAAGNAHDGTGNLGFWKLADATTGWGTFVTLELSANWMPSLGTSVAVSDWVNGSYVIDVYYWTNVASVLVPKRQRSLDGGVTWTGTLLNTTGIAFNTTNNVYLSGSSPVLLGNGTVSSMMFYIKKTTTLNSPAASFYRICYQYDGGSGTFGPETLWAENTDSQDWVLHSLDSYYLNGSYHVVFSGYHAGYDSVPNTNYSIYSTFISTYLSDNTKDVWGGVSDVFVTNSTSTLNYNTFTLPRISYDGTTFYILFRAVVVEQVSTATTGQALNVTTSTYFYLMTSRDLINYSYPSPLIFSDGTVFVDDPLVTGTNGYTFVKQGTYYYTIGNGRLWQYLINNVTADITNSVISYSIEEQAGSSFQIDITLGNMNNQWVGPAPTKSGAAAISKDKKIYLEQGYYLADGTTQTVPRNIFYINDIKQNVTAGDNSVGIVGTDLYKRLKTLTTKFAYNFKGLSSYSDIFNGSTMGNWNTSNGSWSQANGKMICTNPGTTPGLIFLTSVVNSAASSVISCTMKNPSTTAGDPSGASVGIYPIYVDSNNWVKYERYLNGATPYDKVSIMVNGTPSTLIDSFTPNGASDYSKYFDIQIRKYDYSYLDILIGAQGQNNTLASFNTSSSPAPYSLDPVDFGGFFTTAHGVYNGGPALTVTSFAGEFQYFKYLQLGTSQSIQDSMKKLGTLSGVNLYNVEYVFTDNTFPASNYLGTFTSSQGIMSIAPSNTVVNNSFNLANGEIAFKGKIVPTAIGTDASFNIKFRMDGPSPSTTRFYRLEVKHVGGQYFSIASLYLDSPTEYLLTSSSLQYSYSGFNYNTIRFDTLIEHTYRLVLVDQFFYLFIDEYQVLTWQDNASDSNAISFSQGYWGFSTDANTTLKVRDITSRLMWNQIENIAVNPGDDIENSIRTVAGTTRGWLYSDLMGRMNSIILNSTDSPDYTYQNLMYSQNYDNSDKEYVNQVTVYGLNAVTAIYQDRVSIGLTGKVRDLTITDYKITTYQDALYRAQFELVNANKFNTQNNPLAPINVGAEIFDVITIVNTGANSTNVNGNYRVYNQATSNDGSKGRYSIQLETGTL